MRPTPDLVASPLTQLAADRTAAREQCDPWAALCAVATVTAAGQAEIRTLVLRDLEDRLALFFSATSPKWQQLRATKSVAIMIYLPSLQLQYRVRSHWAIIPPEIVHTHWQLRPSIPQRLDWLYDAQAQSTPIDSDDLANLLEAEPPTQAPPGAMGIWLDPYTVERLQLSTGIHERHLYKLTGKTDNSDTPTWLRQTLIP